MNTTTFEVRGDEKRIVVANLSHAVEAKPRAAESAARSIDIKGDDTDRFDGSVRVRRVRRRTKRICAPMQTDHPAAPLQQCVIAV